MAAVATGKHRGGWLHRSASDAGRGTCRCPAYLRDGHSFRGGITNFIDSYIYGLLLLVFK